MVHIASFSLGVCPSNRKTGDFRGRTTITGSSIVDPGAFYEVVY